MSKLILELQDAYSGPTPRPDAAAIEGWLTVGLKRFTFDRDVEMTVRLVNDDESQRLNRDYRHRDKPTNVLSFPGDPDLPGPTQLLGDLVIAADVVAREAADHVVFMDGGAIVEAGTPAQVIDNPSSERTREFFSKVL